MRQIMLPQSTSMAVQTMMIVLISILVVDLSHSSDTSAAAFTSANKVKSPRALSSLSPSSKRHKRRVTDDSGFFEDDEAQQALDVLKRAPGWGKRFYEGDVLESAQKRDPGWGKRSNFQEDNDQESMDKRASTDPGWGKRDPGWGKRSNFQEDNDQESMDKRALADPGWGKRAPGWGKRSNFQEDDDQESIDKRAAADPGWGKRAPGWGKRAPGWGKRAPGWGKRAPGWGKRAPGWGKRAPGWGKRATVWVKRSGATSELCEKLDNTLVAYLNKAKETYAIRVQECGSQETDKELFRK